MATEISLCNLALSYLGDTARVTAIQPPDGSVQASLCATFYPLARDTLLAKYPWNFTKARAALVANTTADSLDAWYYAYDLPTDCMTPVSVHIPGDAGDHKGQDFVTEGDVLYTDIDEAVLRYTTRVTDVSKFPQLFDMALARLLASMLAGPLIKGTEGMKVSEYQLKYFTQIEYPAAITADARAQRNNNYDDFTPSGIEART